MSGLLILFAYLRGLVQGWLTKVVFRSDGMETVARQLRARAGEMREEGEYLRWAAERLAEAVHASRFAVFGGETGAAAPLPLDALSYPALAGDQPALARDPEWNWAEAVIPMRFSRDDTRYLLLGRRRGGRRYLSEDLLRLNQMAAVAAEEVERFRAAEMQRLVSEAELRALHSQINPHFLFNALNTIYGIIPREAAGARRTVLHLSEIFRYFLQSDKKLIPLSEELKIVKAYLEIEQLRLGPRLRVEIDVDPEAERTLIPILSVQPLVENAIKHGVSARAEAGWLRLRARAADGSLTVTVEDSGCPDEAAAPRHSGAGVGLANVTRRLQLCFGPASGVTVRSGPAGTEAKFSAPLTEAPRSQMIKTLIVDDEPIARQVLREELELFPDVLVAGEAADGGESPAPDSDAPAGPGPPRSANARHERASRWLRNLDGPPFPIVVIVTAFDQHAIEAFEAGAVDYLLKPVGEARLRVSVERARNLLGRPAEIAERAIKIAAAQPAAESRPRKIVGRSGAEYILLDLDDVLAFQAERELVWIVTAKHRFLATQSLRAIARAPHRTAIPQGASQRYRQRRSHPQDERPQQPALAHHAQQCHAVGGKQAAGAQHPRGSSLVAARQGDARHGGGDSAHPQPGGAPPQLRSARLGLPIAACRA